MPLDSQPTEVSADSSDLGVAVPRRHSRPSLTKCKSGSRQRAAGDITPPMFTAEALRLDVW